MRVFRLREMLGVHFGESEDKRTKYSSLSIFRCEEWRNAMMFWKQRVYAAEGGIENWGAEGVSPSPHAWST